MKTSVVGNLGQGGLNTDRPTWTLDGSYFTAGTNFRILNGSIYPNARFSKESDNPVDLYPGFIMPVSAATIPYWIIAGRTEVNVYDGASWYDITAATLPLAMQFALNPDDELDWNGCMLGKVPILNHKLLQPYYWNPQSSVTPLLPLPFDGSSTFEDKVISFNVIRAHKNFLFALNLEENGVEFPNAYRWSHPADINGIPYTWDPDDTSALAGRAQLGGDSGAIVDGLSLRDTFMIYSESAINALYPTEDTFVWSRKEVSKTTGLAAKDTLIEVNGDHYFLSDGDVMKTNGNDLVSIAHGRIQYMIFNNMNADYFHRSFTVHNALKTEIWFCIPSASNTFPNVAYIYNYEEDTWAHKRLMTDLKFAAYGKSHQIVPTYESVVGTYAEQVGAYGAPTLSPLSASLLGATETTLTHLDPFVGENQTVSETTIERQNLPLDGQIAVSTIVRAYPHVTGNGEFSIQFGSHDYVNGPIRWKPEIPFNPATQRKIDFRTTGALHAYRITSDSLDIWRFTGMDIEYAEAGAR